MNKLLINKQQIFTRALSTVFFKEKKKKIYCQGLRHVISENELKPNASGHTQVRIHHQNSSFVNKSNTPFKVKQRVKQKTAL